MKRICPDCNIYTNLNEQVKYCSNCGYTFVDMLNLKIDLNKIGNRRSLENVDMD